jgi:SAM-dependent methyltransferase
MSDLKLIARNDLIRTSRVDHADWNYKPGLAYLMRRRFNLALSLMPRARVPRLLEIGFGSGIFLPELCLKCEDLFGIDVHDRVPDVRHVISASGVPAVLSRQDAAHMDFGDGFFDVIVSVSALEFVQSIYDAARECSRVLTAGGRLVIVMPAESRVLDRCLTLLTGESAKRDYGDRRPRVLPALERYFTIARVKTFPPLFPVYRAYEFLKKSPA